MKYILFFLVSVLSFWGCTKHETGISKFEIGTYYGERNTYNKATHANRIDTITIAFDTANYIYAGSYILDSGRGNYFIKNDSIELNDQVARIALYSWDWILGGMYKLIIIDDGIILSKNYSDIQVSYRLKRVTK